MTPINNTREAGRQIASALENEARRSTTTNVAKPYITPAVLSHSGEDILEELGPAQACYPFSSCGVTP